MADGGLLFLNLLGMPPNTCESYRCRHDAYNCRIHKRLMACLHIEKFKAFACPISLVIVVGRSGLWPLLWFLGTGAIQHPYSLYDGMLVACLHTGKG